MNKEENIIMLDGLGMSATVLTDEEVHTVYNKLDGIDSASKENLNNATQETENSNYTSNDNNIIEPMESIPGVDVIPDNLVNDVEETEKDIEEALSPYDLDDESAVQMLKLIDEYKAGKTDSLYLRMPAKLQDMVNGAILTETHGNISDRKKLNTLRNATAKMFIDSFINDAKMTATVDQYNLEMNNAINEMNTEYDNLIGDAVDNVFNRIDEIRAENAEQADKIESIKNAFDAASTFERQLSFAERTAPNKFNKYLNKYKADVIYFNKRVNSNSIGIKVNDVNEIIPVIKMALPQYTEEDIRKFVICICRTIKNVDELDEIAYQYRMISGICKYRFTPIDKKGEVIFNNISKVIEAILS